MPPPCWIHQRLPPRILLPLRQIPWFFRPGHHVSILCTHRSGSFSSFLSSAQRFTASNSSGLAKPNKPALGFECHCVRKHAVDHLCVFLSLNSPPGFVAGPSAGNVIVPSFVSTYCTLGNSSLSHPSLLGSHGLVSEALPATSQFFSPAFFLLPPWLTRSLLCYTNLLTSAQDILLFRRSWLQK